MKVKSFFNKKIFFLGVIIILLILVAFLAPIYRGVNLLSIVSQKRDYYALSEERQELFDKMKIEYVNIKSRITGTAPFNVGEESNENGVDVSDKDDYVRTFDVMKYTVELGVGPNTSHSGVTNSSVFDGGVIKVKAKLPNQGDPTLMRWEKDAWMQNVSYSEDKTEIYAEYHVPNGVSITNANQNLTFTVKVDGYKKEVTSEMAPEFEVWMEGNSPDDATSSANPIKQKDTRNTIISGHQSIDVVLATHNYKVSGTRNGLKGAYASLGVGFAIYQDVSNFSDLRGIEYPVHKIDTEIDMEYLYRDLTQSSTDYSIIDGNTPNASNLLNGAEIVTYTLNGDTKASGYYPANTTWWHQHSSWPMGYKNCSGCSVYNSGTMSANLNNNKLTVGFTDFKINGVFPTKPWASNNKISPKIGYFAFGNIQLFIPYYTNGVSQSYDYSIRSTSKKITYEDINGVTGYYNADDSSSVKDANRGNNIITNGLDIRANGNISIAVGSNKNSGTTWNIGDNYFTDGTTAIVWTQFDVNDGPYEGGSDLLTLWDANYLDITPYSSTSYYNLTTTSMAGYSIYDKTTIETKFGVYKHGETLSNTSERNAAVYEDFNWYETEEEAREHGKISAYYFHYPANKGFYFRHNLYLKFNTKVPADEVGNTTYVLVKARVFRDKEKKDEIKYGGANYYNSDTVFVPTQYNANGERVKNETPHNIGESFLLVGNRTSIQLSVEDKDSSGNWKSSYDIQDGEIHLKNTPTLWNGKSTSDSDVTVNSVIVKTTLPKGLSYKKESSNKEPSSVIVNTDGTTTITWEYANWQVNHDAPEYPEITFTADISASLENNASLNIKSIIYTEEDKRDEKQFRTSEYGVVISNLAGSKALKEIDKPVVEKNEKFNITSTLGNNSEEILRNVRTIEILPTNNDEKGSKFSGNYTTKITEIIDGQKLYYTNKNISEIGLTEDKYGKLTIKDVDLENDSRWIEVNVGDTIPNDATAIATMIPQIPSQSEVTFNMEITPSNNKESDKYGFSLNMTSDNLQAAIKTNTVVTTVVSRNIKGKVFIDKNRNDIFDDNDELLKNNIVKLLDQSGNIIKTTQTNDNGNYEFLSVEKGSYYVEFNIPDNYEVITKGQSSRTNINGRTDLINSLNIVPQSALIEELNVDMGIKKISAIIKVRYEEYGNPQNLFDSKDFDKYYGDSYNLDNDYTPNIPDNYEFKSKTNNYTGVVDQKEINITYYYQKKDSKLTNSITKQGTSELVNKDGEVEYKIIYKTKINDYLGNAKITIIDKLPLEIDENNVELDGGEYDKNTKTIKWEVDKEIKSINEPEIVIEKTIKFKYLNINPKERGIINTVEGTTKLDNNERSIENTYKTDLKIPGKIIVKYLEVDDDNNVIGPLDKDIEKTELIGETFTSTEKQFEGYELIEKPEIEEVEFEENEQILVYNYKKIKLKVETIVHGIGGNIVGDEVVYYGENSTKDKIVIEAEDGYQIERIVINGEEIKINGIQTKMILDNFKEMKEDKLVEVSFKKIEKINNPATGNKIFLTIFILFCIMLYTFKWSKIRAINKK